MMNTNFLILFLALFVLGNSICSNSNQVDGQCSSCGPIDILVTGNCYPKIRGCMNYTVGPACAECQFGYVLSMGTCIREAVFYNQTNTSIPPVNISIQTLTLDQIKDLIGQQYKNYFTDAHEIFLSKHPELGKGNVKSIDKLETKKGTFLVAVYETATQKYEATALVDLDNKVRQFSFSNFTTQRKDPFTTNKLLIQIQGSNLTGYIPFQVKLVGDNYTFDYMNPNLNVTRIEFNRNNVGSTLGTKLTIRKLNATNLGRQEMALRFPELASQTVTGIARNGDFHILTMGINFTCSIKFTNYRFEVYKPINASYNFFLYKGIMRPKNWNSFQYTITWGDTKYAACLNAATTMIPQLASLIDFETEVSQNSLGTIYNIGLQKSLFSSDLYSVMVMYTKQNTIFIIQITRNDIVYLYTESLNYNAEPGFYSTYISAINISKVLNVPPIENVTLRFTGNVKYYKVIYSSYEFMEFSYNLTSGVLKVISYTVNNENILDIVNVVGPTDKKEQSQVYLEYLRRASYTSPWSFIESFIDQTIVSIITWVTSLGTYSASLKKQPTTIAVNNLQQVSQKTCFDVSNWAQSSKIKSIDSYLRSNYNLNGFNIQLAQTKVKNIGNRYRILYSNTKLKQYQFLVEELYTLFNVIKTTTLNGGYALVDPIPQNADYQRMLTYLSTSNMAGNKIPILTENTTTNIRGYYDDGKSTQEIIITRSNGTAKTTVFANRTYLLIPDGFNMAKLLMPGTPSVEDQDALLIIQMMLPMSSDIPGLEGANVVFADKPDANTYNLMLKTVDNVYVQVKANALDGQYTFPDITATAYKDSDFGKCTLFSAVGKCLSCSATQLQYQGNCWEKLQGCLAQAGANCLRCQVKYKLENKICKKACSDLII